MPLSLWSPFTVIGKSIAVCVLVPEEPQHDAAHRVGRVPTVTQNLFPGVVAGPPRIHSKRSQQITERLQWQPIALQGVSQGHEGGMGCVPGPCPFQVPLPAIQRLQAGSLVFGFIGEIVRVARKGVHRMYGGAQVARQQPGADRKVFIVAARLRRAVCVCFLERRRLLGGSGKRRSGDGPDRLRRGCWMRLGHGCARVVSRVVRCRLKRCLGCNR